MRKIKYRGYDNENKTWRYGWYTKLLEGIRKFDAIIVDEDGGLTRYYIHDPETIGQYTGLKDKNGVEIFEGDITTKGIVIYHTGLTWDGGCVHPGFYFDHRTDIHRVSDDDYVDLDYHTDFYCIGIIGNIHENPELLETN